MSTVTHNTLDEKETLRLAKHAKSHGFSPMLFNPYTKRPDWPSSKKDEDKWTNVSNDVLFNYIKGKSGNIAIRTGKHSGNLVVFDCDLPRNGDKEKIDGVSSFRSFLKNQEVITKNLRELQTVMDISGSGGRRVYYYYPEDMVFDSAKVQYFKQNLNIDVLIDGKACIYPGSKYPGCSPLDEYDKHKCAFTNGKCEFIWASYKWVEGYSPDEISIKKLPAKLERFFEEVAASTNKDSIKAKNSYMEYNEGDVANVKKMLELVNDSAWDCNYSQWILIVWSLVKFGCESEYIHDQCSRSSKYNRKSTQKVIDDYKDHEYSYGPKSKFYKWCQDNLKDSIKKDTLLNFMHREITLTDYDLLTIDTNIKVNNLEGIVRIFNYFWGSDNVKTFGDKGIKSNFYKWDPDSRLWEYTHSSRIYSKLCNVITPILKSYITYREKYTETVNKLIYALGKNMDEGKILQYIAEHCMDTEFPELINKSTYEIATSDGKIIDLKTGKARDRVRTDYWSMCCPAKLTNADLTVAESFLSSICCNDNTQIRYIKMMMGYFLTRDIEQRKLYIGFGNGRNGKSVLANILKSILGGFYSAGSSSLFFTRIKQNGNANPELVNLVNARLVVISDTSKGEKLDEENIKTLTGDDTINARPLYSNPLSIVVGAKFLIFTNDKPIFNASDPAMIDRINFIPFDAKFENTPENREYVRNVKTLVDEFFTIAVRGVCDFYKNMGEYNECIRITNGTKEYVEENDDYQSFINENIVECKDSKIYSKDLAKRYFRVENPSVRQIKEINKEFELRKYVKGRNKIAMFIKDIKFRELEEES